MIAVRFEEEAVSFFIIRKGTVGIDKISKKAIFWYHKPAPEKGNSNSSYYMCKSIF